MAVMIEIFALGGLSGARTRHPEDFGVLSGRDGLDAEALALLDDEHFSELGVGLEIGEWNYCGELFDGAHIDHKPAGVVGRGFGVVIFRFLVEGGVVRICLAGDFGDSYNVGWRSARVVKEYAIPFCHLLHRVTCLVIADTVPVVGIPG